MAVHNHWEGRTSVLLMTSWPVAQECTVTGWVRLSFSHPRFPRGGVLREMENSLPFSTGLNEWMRGSNRSWPNIPGNIWWVVVSSYLKGTDRIWFEFTNFGIVPSSLLSRPFRRGCLQNNWMEEPSSCKYSSFSWSVHLRLKWVRFESQETGILF